MTWHYFLFIYLFIHFFFLRYSRRFSYIKRWQATIKHYLDFESANHNHDTIAFKNQWFNTKRATKLCFAQTVFSSIPCLFCILNFNVILTRLNNICITDFLSKCYLWFCSYFIKAICKFVKTWNLYNKNLYNGSE